MECEKLFVVFHVDFHLLSEGDVGKYLLATLVVRHSKTISDLYFCSIITAYPQHCPNDSFLICIPSQGVVEDGEQHDRFDRCAQWGL